VQWHRCGDRMDASDGIELLGVLAAARERHADAARLLAAADAARRPLRYLAPGFTANRGAAAAAVSQPRHALGEDRFTQSWEEGQGLTQDDAVAYAARKGGGRKRPATGWASLTPAERDVARLAGEGLRNDAIAQRLFITPGTVKVHLTHIFAKLGITTRAELAARAASHDLTARLSREQDMHPLSRGRHRLARRPQCRAPIPGGRPSAMENGLAHHAAMLSRRAALGVKQAGLVRGDDELYPVPGAQLG
jgi:DNA-binding CsgD family transcriptional regulator